jgi:hypothetical protein
VALSCLLCVCAADAVAMTAAMLTGIGALSLPIVGDRVCRARHWVVVLFTRGCRCVAAAVNPQMDFLGAKAIAAALPRCHKLIEVNLDRAWGSCVLLSSLPSPSPLPSPLSSSSLASLPLRSRGMRASPTLHVCYAAGNVKLGPEGALVLLDALRGLKNLQVIRVRCTRCTPRSCACHRCADVIRPVMLTSCDPLTSFSSSTVFALCRWCVQT